jgi:hypothetical protein
MKGNDCTKRRQSDPLQQATTGDQVNQFSALNLLHNNIWSMGLLLLP